MTRLLFVTLLLGLVAPSVRAESTHRLHDGITAFVNNAEGKDFAVTLTVRDINIYETGPREVLLKVYDPEGKPLVREVIPDDGVSSRAFLPPMGAWDHEAWYYAYCYMKGTQPMIRWSAFSAPDRLASIAKRTFEHKITSGKKGIYKVLVVGAVDHYVSLKFDPALPYAVAGHPDWLHGHGQLWRKSFLYVPRGAIGMHVLFAEYDLPRDRQLKISAPGGAALFEGGAEGAFTRKELVLDKALQEKVLTVEVSEGKGDFLVGLKFRMEKDAEIPHRGSAEKVIVAAFAPDEATARAVQGGAIYHDGKVFWSPFQVRLHDWLKKLGPKDFEVVGADGKPADPGVIAGKEGKAPALATKPGFFALNGIYSPSPLCDRILHNYPAHKNRQALNVALRDLHGALRIVGPNDHAAIAIAGPFANMAYEFSNYGWPYWRAGWRILKESDAPDDVKAIVREAFLLAGDRLAFCRTWERVNGNSFAQIPSALRYCYEATGDPMQKELFETYWQRFTTGGWGERTGVGPSGPVQEGFGYAYHYASYILDTWRSVTNDFKEERFQKVYDGVRTWFSYTLADEGVAAGPWSTRTSFIPPIRPEKDGPFAWKGLPGPDFTVSINDANEFFAARRKNYYALTYHGRLSPKWESNAHPGQSGYGGGMLVQLQVPGQGIVLASTLNGPYGEGMDTSLWRNFHLNTVVGQTADARPLVTGDSEHADARLKGNVVTSSGDVRDTSLGVSRSYTFDPASITCQVQLRESKYHDLLSLWLKNELRGKVAEAYEMIPFHPKAKAGSKNKGGDTLVTLDTGTFGKEAATARTITIDRGGFGVRIELDQPRPVLRGANNTVLIRLADAITPAGKVGMTYKLVPFGN